MAFGFFASLAQGLFGRVGLATAATALVTSAAASAIAPSAVWLYTAIYSSPGGALALSAFIFIEIVTAFGIVQPRALQISQYLTRTIAVGMARFALRLALSRSISCVVVSGLRRASGFIFHLFAR